MHRRLSVALTFCAALAAFALAGCAMSDDQLAHFVVSPAKYTLYTCADIAREAKVQAAHERQLEQLMAKAGVDAGGRLVSSIAYQPDYLTVRGEINELRAAAVAKHCETAAASTAPAARTSDAAIH